MPLRSQEQDQDQEQEQKEDPGSAGSEPPGSGSPAPDQGAPIPDPPPVAEPPSPAAEIFEPYLAGWKQHVGGARPPKLDDKRRRLIRARLRDFSADELKAAAGGIWRSEWHVSNRQTAFELVMRDSAHVEQFRDMRPGTSHHNPRSTLQQAPVSGRLWKVGPES